MVDTWNHVELNNFNWTEENERKKHLRPIRHMNSKYIKCRNFTFYSLTEIYGFMHGDLKVNKSSTIVKWTEWGEMIFFPVAIFQNKLKAVSNLERLTQGI